MLIHLTLLVAVLAPAAEPIPLASRINDIVADHKGKFAVACVHLGTREQFTRNVDDVMPTASLIKLPIMAEVYFQAKEGKVKLDDMLTLTKEEMVEGAGILARALFAGRQVLATRHCAPNDRLL